MSLEKRPSEVRLMTPTIMATVEGKEYEISFSDDGIFILSKEPIEVVKQSKTKHWLIVK
jgi:hypothetical protein